MSIFSILNINKKGSVTINKKLINLRQSVNSLLIFLLHSLNEGDLVLDFELFKPRYGR